MRVVRKKRSVRKTAIAIFSFEDGNGSYSKEGGIWKGTIDSNIFKTMAQPAKAMN